MLQLFHIKWKIINFYQVLGNRSRSAYFLLDDCWFCLVLCRYYLDDRLQVWSLLVLFRTRWGKFDWMLKFYQRLFMKLVRPKHKIEFNTAYYILNAIFSQSFVWFGVYFSPFLLVIQLFKLFIMFFLSAVGVYFFIDF